MHWTPSSPLRFIAFADEQSTSSIDSREEPVLRIDICIWFIWFIYRTTIAGLVKRFTKGQCKRQKRYGTKRTPTQTKMRKPKRTLGLMEQPLYANKKELRKEIKRVHQLLVNAAMKNFDILATVDSGRSIT